ncbi:single-stranded DNA-binding protein [uncultured Brevibacterium sp.]|uniref:single-stranded DNA-binding protein n=1 Tax=uncultured Brevibacterium sp. TaxID=189678 RepID=UPI0025D58713|nr:single-stranded DNA-binding protein [uncultured Brevibacterium sp.]
MAGDTVITVVGNLTADPELRFTPNGAAVANFTVASTPRTFDRASGEFKDGETLFLRCSVWREFAENVAGSLSRGTRVVVQGRLKSRTFDTKEGDRRTVFELDVDEMGPSLRYATANVSRNERSGGYGGGNQGGPGGAGGQGGQGGQGNWGNQGGSGWNNSGGAGGYDDQRQSGGGWNNSGSGAGNQSNDPWQSSRPQGNQGGWGNPTNEEPPF